MGETSAKVEMLTYPKIETLYYRHPETFKVIVGKFRLPEFALIDRWEITEKIDGTNMRVGWDGEQVAFAGRTERSQFNRESLGYLQATFPAEKLRAVFPDFGVTLYGELYGPKIQKGHLYRDDLAFALFDVMVGGLWLQQEAVRDIALKLGVVPVPSLGNYTAGDAVKLIAEHGFLSVAAHHKHDAEGIVAKAPYGVLTRRGERLMWKLKTKDFAAAGSRASG